MIVLFRNIERRFSAYSSPVTLISRKVTKHMRVGTDFRHLNVRIAKNNLAIPLLKDTFSVLGSSRCKVFSVLYLKDICHCLKAFRKFQKVLWNITIFWLHFILISKNTYEIEYISINLAILYKHNFRLFTK